MVSVAGSTRPSCVRVRRSAPNERGGSSLGLEHLVSRRSMPGMLRPWARAGSRRFPGDPSYASALLQDPGRADKTSPVAVLPTPPPAYPNRRPQRVHNVEANTGLQHPLSTLLERRRRLPCKTRFRLAGCASTGRGSNPLDRFERFQVTFPFSFPGLLLSQEQLVAKITTGSLVHADETQARMVGKTGYVWVLSSLEEVVYVYSDTREGDMIQSMLGEFRGVLVSDFYAVYDSIKCVQQKCLIHLMRDINDDLHKHPFDLELRSIAQDFARLLRPMVATIDRHGLRKRFLSKHVADVDKFYSRLSQGTLTSGVALGYEKRFVKYRGKLFSFLKHNDVPWNNNNAENAIRAFGELREIIKGVATEKGLREYLVLLSVCETCKRRGISFLEFLLSEETNIDTFAARKTSHLRGSVREGTREKGQQPRLPRGSSGGRRNATVGPGELSRHQRDDRNVPERDGERVIRTQKFGSPIEEKREPVVLRGGGPALNVPGACGECAGHDGESNSIKLENIDRGRGPSIPTFTPHDERRSSAGASVLPDGRNPECTCAVNDRCLVRTQNGHRVVIASGVVLAQYAVGDHMAESYAMVNLVNQGLANQTDVARAFGCSTRSVRRHQRRFEDGGLAALDRSPGYPRGRARVAGSRRQLVQDLNLQGHSHREIARRIGVSEKAIRKLVANSLKPGDI